jgi:hypothetical protein
MFLIIAILGTSLIVAVLGLTLQLADAIQGN